ncbi:MAG: OmpH family outer membrane protein [Gemmatimonadaceae bacterium]
MACLVRAALVAPALLFACAAGAAAQAQPQAPKLGYINSQAILAAAPGRAAAESLFQREVAQYRQQVQRMGDSLNTLVARYDSVQGTLSAADRQTRQREIQQREQAYQQRAQQLQQQMAQREQDLVRPIMQQVNTIINTIRAEGRYTLIFDVGGSAGVVVAADSSLDLTQQVITRLRAASPARPAASPPAGAPAAAPSGVTRPRNPSGSP